MRVVFGLVNFVLVFTLFAPPFLLQPLVWITSVVVVYLDTEEINKEGKRTAGRGREGVLVLFFWIISLPWYLFRSRPKAISVSGLQNAVSQEALEVIKKLGELKDKGVV